MADRTFTDLELERSLAGDLPPARMTAIETQSTDADRARLAELAAEHAAFLATVDVDAEVRRIQQRVEPAPKRATWLRWLAPMGALAAAAVVVVVLVNRRGPTPAIDDDLRTKGGGVSLVIYLGTGTTSQRLGTGDTVTAGARIRFEAQGTIAGYVAIVGIDGAGVAAIDYPYGGTAPAAIGDQRLLPGAIQLDATPGDEHFYAVFSTHTFDLAAAASALRAGTLLPDGVSASDVILHKR